MNKIFGIGLSRTGTTSLSLALGQDNFDIIHYPKTKAELFNLQASGACDLPVALYYKELDEKYPNSKFVYTIREKSGWLDSMESHFARKRIDRLQPWSKQNRMDMYGQLTFDREVFAEIYDAHDKDVREYFKEREQDLLILNICGGDDLKVLLDFIGISSDNKKFPHKNKRRT